MNDSTALFAHIAAGGLALLSGAAAMAAPKGSPPHRTAGNIFFVAMLAASGSAVYLASFVRPFMPGFVEGLLTFYLVSTAWETVMRREGTIGVTSYAMLFIGLTTVAAGLTIGFEAATNGTGLKDGIPPPFYYAFAGIAAFGAVFDVKVIVRRGIAGKLRIVRHLWRMSFALLLATVNFFIGNGAKVFPAEVRATKVLLAPVLILLVLLIFWIIRVRFTKWYKET